MKALIDTMRRLPILPKGEAVGVKPDSNSNIPGKAGKDRQ